MFMEETTPPDASNFMLDKIISKLSISLPQIHLSREAKLKYFYCPFSASYDTNLYRLLSIYDNKVTDFIV